MATPRIETLDIVRGVALLGILLLNIIGLGLPGAAYTNPEAAGGTGLLNLGVWAAVYVAFDGKMRALFAMLFGASMLLVAQGAGDAAPAVHLRRMAVLLAIGLVHALGFWQGDILVYYAVIGALLFPLWQKGPRTLLLIAGLLLLMQSAVHYSAAFTGQQLAAAAAAPGAGEAERDALIDFRASLEATPGDIAAETAAVQGSWIDSFHHRANELRFFYGFLFPMVFLLETSAQMLVGMALFRLGWWQGGRATSHYLRFGAVAIPVGLGLMALVARGYWASGFDPIGFFKAEALRVLIGPLIALGYAAMLIAVARAGLLPRLMARLAAVGRMALSNYLLTTLLCSILFQGWGLGQFGQLQRWQLYLVVAAVWAVLLTWSKPWLARHHYGPAEWLWRSLARWKRQPLQKSAT